MCTGHDDAVGADTVARLSRRGFLRTAVTTAAVVGTSGALSTAPSGWSTSAAASTAADDPV